MGDARGDERRVRTAQPLTARLHKAHSSPKIHEAHPDEREERT